MYHLESPHFCSSAPEQDRQSTSWHKSAQCPRTLHVTVSHSCAFCICFFVLTHCQLLYSFVQYLVYLDIPWLNFFQVFSCAVSSPVYNRHFSFKLWWVSYEQLKYLTCSVCYFLPKFLTARPFFDQVSVAHSFQFLVHDQLLSAWTVSLDVITSIFINH